MCPLPNSSSATFKSMGLYWREIANHLYKKQEIVSNSQKKKYKPNKQIKQKDKSQAQKYIKRNNHSYQALM